MSDIHATPACSEIFCAFNLRADYLMCLRVSLCVSFVHLYSVAKFFCAFSLRANQVGLPNPLAGQL